MSGASAHAHAHPNYVKVWAILLVLLVISVAGPELGNPIITLVTAFGIAVIKAYMVAKNFMHLNIERKIAVYMLVTGLAFMLLFFAGVAPDVLNHDGHQWENQAAKAEIERAMKAAEASGHAGH
ncbi:MAG: caa(3)-type oxidase subunit IV [Myxococcales bacterium FL481]|nr:MAG: caa(3)-type oxidase subunit IV [Myxococcales bacterium FL481]